MPTRELADRAEAIAVCISLNHYPGSGKHPPEHHDIERQSEQRDTE